jgi:ABC-type dipeptide/oligopeptide/nickel transport system permease component
VPGIYLTVALMPFATVLIVEDKPFNEAWNRCFTIIKDHFWISLGIYLLVYIIYSFSSSIISVIVGGIAGLISYFTTNNISATVGIVTSILSIFSFVFYIIFYVSVCLHYFNLAERHDGTGMLQRLNELGGSDNDFNNVHEQY